MESLQATEKSNADCASTLSAEKMALLMGLPCLSIMHHEINFITVSETVLAKGHHA
jgi:hypothetical protein